MSVEDENLEPIEDVEDANPVEETEALVEEESHLEETDVEDDGEHEESEDATEDDAYEPNYIYRRDGEDYEMNDELKALVTNPESEALVRELAEKADGLDLLKDQRQHLRDENLQLQHLETQRQQAVGQLQNYVKNGDWEPFQKTWNISDDAVLQRAVQIMQVREMPPEDQAAYQANVQAREQNYVLQQQNQQLQHQQSQMATHQRENELMQTLHHEQYSGAAQQFDERAGRPGAFRDEIIKRGQYYANVHNKDIPPHVLANELMAYVQPAQAQQHQTQTRVVQPKPTLPRLKGGSSSPIKGGVKTIADIRARAQSMGG